jgi:hypothetical protein
MKRRHLTAYDVAEHYDEAYFADLTARYRTRNRFARRRISNVLSLLPELAGATLLDVGCGMGTFTVETAARGAMPSALIPQRQPFMLPRAWRPRQGTRPRASSAAMRRTCRYATAAPT